MYLGVCFPARCVLWSWPLHSSMLAFSYFHQGLYESVPRLPTRQFILIADKVPHGTGAASKGNMPEHIKWKLCQICFPLMSENILVHLLTWGQCHDKPSWDRLPRRAREAGDTAPRHRESCPISLTHPVLIHSSIY